MATRVIAAQDKTSSGAGDDVQIKAGNANTSGAGGSIILQPGSQVTTGGDGFVQIKGTGSSTILKLTESAYNRSFTWTQDYSGASLSADGGLGGIILFGRFYIDTGGKIRSAYNNYVGLGNSNSQHYDNWGYIYLRNDGVINWWGDAGLTYGSVGTIRVSNASTGGGSLAYTSSTPTALSTNPTNDLVLTGSAFQRLSSSSALSVTGIAPPATGSHVDGRLIWLYNVGSFNITLKHSQTSTAANQFINEGSGDVVLGPGRMVQAIYDSTSSKWRVNGETYPYVFPTADGTNGQVLTTNGSGTLSWATVSAGASASGTTNYIAKFTGASTLGNSLVYDDGSNVGIGTTSSLGRLDVVGANVYEPIRGITSSASNLESGSNNTLGLSVNNSNTTAGNGIAIGFNTATTNSTLYGVGAVGFNNLTHTTLGVPQGKFQVITRDSGGGLTPKLTIDTSGNVGIGTASPSNNLSIGASAGKIGFQRGSGDGEYCTIGFKSTTGNDRYVFEINNSSGTGELRLNQGGTSTPIGMTFYTNNAEKMRIDSSGNVGICTSSPQSTLDTRGLTILTNSTGGNYNENLRLPESTSGYSVIHMGGAVATSGTGANQWALLKAGSGLSHRFEIRHNTSTAFSISTAGDVGVNTTSPGAKLQIDTGATGTKGQIIKAFLGQSANLSEWQDSTGTVLASIDSAGRMTLAAGAAASNADLYFNNTASVNPGIKWNTVSGLTGLRFYSGATLVGAFQDNGVCVTTAGFATYGGMNYGSFTIYRTGGASINFNASGAAISVSAGSLTTADSTMQITTPAASKKGLVIAGVASQTGNLTEWQDSTGTVVAAVSPNGAFTGSSFTPYGTFNSTTTIFGNNYWTPNYTGGVTSPSAGTYTKSTGNANTWDGQVYSSEGYTKNVYCAARASQTNGHIMFGLNSDPTTDGNYTSLDYAWYPAGDGILYIYENNVNVASYGTYTTSNVLSITYDGSNVQYWKDGVIQRTVARSTGNPLYFDTSFYTLSSSLNSVQFGPIGQPFGISGTSGYLPKFTSQQTLGNSVVYDNGGSVGIGTSSPVRLLDLYNATTPVFAMHNSTTGTTAEDGFLIYLSGSDSFIQNKESTGVMGFIVGGNTERMRIDASGNVGVGAGARIGAGTGYINAGATAAGYLELYNATSGATTLMNTGAFNVLVGTNNTERIRVTSSGLVGIGTSTIAGNNPLADLHVNDASGYGSLQLSQSPAGATIDTGGEIQFAATYRSTSDLTQVARIRGLRENATNNNWAGYLAFYTSTGSDNPSASTERMRINSSGNVGIGTTSPGSKLTIKGQGTSPSIAIQRTSDTTEQFKLINAEATAYTTVRGTSSGSWATVLENSNANFMISTNNAGGTGGSIFLDANSVGINTTSPGARLQVDTGATGTKGQIIKAFLGQSANLSEWQSSTGTALGYINSDMSQLVTPATFTLGSQSNNSGVVELYSGTVRLRPSSLGNYIFTLTQRGVDIGAGVGDTVPVLKVTRYADGNVGPVAQFVTGSTTHKGLVITGVASQTGNLQEWQNNSGTALSYVASNGDIFSTTNFVHYGSGGSTGYILRRSSDNATMGSFTWASGSAEATLYSLAFMNFDASTNAGIRMGWWSTWADSVTAQTMWLKNSNIIWGNNALGVTNRTAFNTSSFQITAGSYATIPVPTSRFEVYGDSQFLSQSTSAKTVVVKAAASQTANLTEWQNNGGTALAYMDANGNFAAVTKSFLITHPTPAKAAEGKKLRYASLEGPENGVYFRGTLTGENEIILPDYWKDLVDPDSITVNLTARKRPQPNLFVVDANAEKVIVESDREICCDFIVYATRKDIAKLEVEPDGN